MTKGKKVLLVIYGEIALRGDNKHLFIRDLMHRIKDNLKEYDDFWIKKEQGRLLLELDEDLDFDYFIPRVANVFGVVGVCPCIKTENQDIENIKELAVNYLKDEYGDKEATFKVETKRADKSYPILSPEFSARMGSYILDSMPNLKVDVHNPEIRLNVELRNDAYIYSKVVKGRGGLPVGSSGVGVLLLSGGIDSPVAGFLAAKRGVALEAVYFHSPPFTSNRAKEKVKDIAEQLAFYTSGINLNIVNFTDLQLKLKESVEPEKLTIFLKRAMLKTSAKIADMKKANALFVGDSIGQVASQTLAAMRAIDSVTDYPIIRPLASMDKQEIIDIARDIGTYEISILPYEDCCTIFVADHPETRPKKTVIERMEKNIEGLDELINECVENIERIEIR